MCTKLSHELINFVDVEQSAGIRKGQPPEGATSEDTTSVLPFNMPQMEEMIRSAIKDSNDSLLSEIQGLKAEVCLLKTSILEDVQEKTKKNFLLYMDSSLRIMAENVRTELGKAVETMQHHLNNASTSGLGEQEEEGVEENAEVEKGQNDEAEKGENDEVEKGENDEVEEIVEGNENEDGGETENKYAPNICSW